MCIMWGGCVRVRGVSWAMQQREGLGGQALRYCGAAHRLEKTWSLFVCVGGCAHNLTVRRDSDLVRPVGLMGKRGN